MTKMFRGAFIVIPLNENESATERQKSSRLVCVCASLRRVFGQYFLKYDNVVGHSRQWNVVWRLGRS